MSYRCRAATAAAASPVVALRSLLTLALPRCRFTFIEQKNLKVVEMFFQVDTDGNGELDIWEFEDALVRGSEPSLTASLVLFAGRVDSHRCRDVRSR